MRILILAVCLLAVMGISYCQAAEHPGVSLEHPGAALPLVTSGSVVSADAVSDELIITAADGTERVMAVSEDTMITRRGEEISLSDIAAGTSVTVTEEEGVIASIVAE